MFLSEQTHDWLKKIAIFVISIIIHGLALILLIQAFTPVTIINFPFRVTPVIITPREGFPLPPVAPAGVPGSAGAAPASGKPAEKKEAAGPLTLEERLSRLEKGAAVPSPAPKPLGPMPLPPFHLAPSRGERPSSFSLKLPAPEEKGPAVSSRERAKPTSPHDYWKYILATQPGKEPKEARSGASLPAPGGGVSGASPRVAIEGPGYDLSPWAQEVVSRLQRNWQIAAARAPVEKGALRLLVAVDKKGEVSSLRILTPSQNAAFDRSALDAVHLSLPLPQLPPAFPSEVLEITIIFECDESKS